VRGIPYLVILDANGKVSTDQGVRIVREYGMDGYPFSAERIEFLKEEEEAAKKNQSLSSILVSGSRDYLVSNDGNKVHFWLSTLIDHFALALFFSLCE